ncbi:hypothetical protein [Streptosporangium sandarakinum]
MASSIPWIPAVLAAQQTGLPLQTVIRMAGSGRVEARMTGTGWEIAAHAVAALRRPVPAAVFLEPVSELATFGDVLAEYAGPEDAAAAYLAARADDDPERPAPSYRGGPELDDQTEYEYEREKRT